MSNILRNDFSEFKIQHPQIIMEMLLWENEAAAD